MSYRVVVSFESNSDQLLVASIMGMGCRVQTMPIAELVDLDPLDLDLLLIELSLPNLAGLRVCRRLRSEPKTRHIAIIGISGVAEPAIEIEAFQAGADDFVVRPISIPVLRHRVNALLGRRPQLFSLDRPEDLVLDDDTSSVRCEGSDVRLAHVEFALLRLLLQYRGQVVTREQVLNSLSKQVKPRTIDVNVMSLRAKLGQYGKSIDTIRGLGYRFNT